MKTGQDGAPQPGQAHIVTGMVAKSGGVKLLIPMTLAVAMEEACEGEASMIDFSHWKAGFSGGGIFATIFSQRLRDRSVPMTARQARNAIIPVIYEEFGRADPGRLIAANTGHDVFHLLGGHKPKPDTRGSLTSLFLFHALHGAAFATREITRHIARTNVPPVPYQTVHLAYRPLSSAAINLTRRYRAAVERRQAVKHQYDHSIFERAVYNHFGLTRVGDAAQPLFLPGYNTDLERPVIFGAFRGAQFPDSDEETSLQILKMGDPADPDKIPVYIDTPVADALTAVTSIRGIMPRHRVKNLDQHVEDSGDHTMPLLDHIVDAVVARTKTYLQSAKAKKAYGLLSFLPRLGDSDNITPIIVPRLIILGVGIDPILPSASVDAGFFSQVLTFPRIPETITRHSFVTGFRAKWDRLSRRFTGRGALLEIDALNMPAAGDAEAHLYPSQDMRVGTIDNQERLTWFAAERVLRNNAKDLADEMIIALHALRDQGDKDWTDERLSRAELNIRKNLCTPQGLNNLCKTITMSAQEITAVVENQNTSQNIPVPVGIRRSATPAPDMPRAVNS